MLLVFDIGTSVLKGGLFQENGTLVSRHEVPMKLIKSQDPLHHEADAGEWILALKQVVDALHIGGREIRAVVVSGNGPTLVPVGEDTNPLAYAMSWMDRRGIEEAKIITEKGGAFVDPTFYLPKAYWFFRNRPEIYRNTKYFFSCPEYVAYLLSGVPVAFLPAPDFTRYIWKADLIESLGMDTAKFPPFVKPGRIIGSVSEIGERVSGIPRGAPVVSAGPDFIVSLLGTATVHPGRACDRSGTSEGINLCAKEPKQDRRILCLGHVIEGLYNISGPISTSGKALEWFKVITGKEHASYESLFEDIRDVPAGSKRLVFLPYLTGERAPLWDPLARGTFVGLTLSHGRREMTRAVVESVGYAIRDVVEVMEEIGFAVEDLRITGSQAKSAAWNQIKADITGRRIRIPISQGMHASAFTPWENTVLSLKHRIRSCG